MLNKGAIALALLDQNTNISRDERDFIIFLSRGNVSEFISILLLDLLPIRKRIAKGDVIPKFKAASWLCPAESVLVQPSQPLCQHNSGRNFAFLRP